MAFVRVEQRNAHLASARAAGVRAGPRRSTRQQGDADRDQQHPQGFSGDNRGEEATAILWTLWGKQAENAAQYLGKGSHVNVVGRVQNNNYEKDGETVYSMAFTAEEIDYLDTKAEGEALRAKQGNGSGRGPARAAGQAGRTRQGARARRAARLPPRCASRARRARRPDPVLTTAGRSASLVSAPSSHRND